MRITNLFLIMLMTKEWLLTFGTNKMFHMPLFTQSINNTFFDGTTTGTTDGNAHLIMTPKTIKFTLYLAST